MLLFLRVQDQWRVGASGPTGYDYSYVLFLMGRMSLQAQEFDWLLEDIEVLAAAALSEMTRTPDR